MSRGGDDAEAEAQRARPHDAHPRLAAPLQEVVAQARPPRGPFGVGAGHPAGVGLRGGDRGAAAVRPVHDPRRLGAVCGVRLDAPGRDRTICLRGGGHRAGCRALCRLDLTRLPDHGHRAHRLRRRRLRPARRAPDGLGLELPRQVGPRGLHLRGRVRSDRRPAAEDPRDTQSRGLVLGRAGGRGAGSRADQPRHAGGGRRGGRNSAPDALHGPEAPSFVHRGDLGDPRRLVA